MKGSRGALIERAILATRLLHTRRSVSVDEIAEALGCCRRNAYRWLTELSVVLPVRRIRTDSGVRYGLLGGPT